MNLLFLLQSLAMDLECYVNEEKIIEDSLRGLAREKYISKLKKTVQPVVERSRSLRESVSNRILELQNRSRLFSRFNGIYSRTLTALMKLDAELTRIEFAISPDQNSGFDPVRTFHVS